MSEGLALTYRVLEGVQRAAHPSPQALQTLETALSDRGAQVPGMVNVQRGTCRDLGRQPSHITLKNFIQQVLGAYFHYPKQKCLHPTYVPSGIRKEETMGSCLYGCCDSATSSPET